MIVITKCDYVLGFWQLYWRWDPPDTIKSFFLKRMFLCAIIPPIIHPAFWHYRSFCFTPFVFNVNFWSRDWHCQDCRPNPLIWTSILCHSEMIAQLKRTRKKEKAYELILTNELFYILYLDVINLEAILPNFFSLLIHNFSLFLLLSLARFIAESIFSYIINT